MPMPMITENNEPFTINRFNRPVNNGVNNDNQINNDPKVPFTINRIRRPTEQEVINEPINRPYRPKVPLVEAINEPFTINRTQRAKETNEPNEPKETNEPFTINRTQRTQRAKETNEPNEPKETNEPFTINRTQRTKEVNETISKEEVQTDWKNIRNKAPLPNTKSTIKGAKTDIKPIGGASSDNDFISKYYKKS
jgi:hypothetical protein